MKTILPLITTMLLTVSACKKHEPAPTPIATQPTDSMKNTVPPLDPPKSFVKHLLGTYKGKAYRKQYSHNLADSNFVAPDPISWDVEMRVTEVDKYRFKVEQWDSGADSATGSFILQHEAGDVYNLAPGAPITRQLKFANDSLFYTNYNAFLIRA